MDRKTLVACLSLLLASCSTRNTIIVGSKNFTEQVLLGEIIAQQIEAKLGARVIRRLDLGGTMLAHEALKGGSIDVYPEYTGTALTEVLKRPILTEPKAAFEAVRDAYHLDHLPTPDEVLAIAERWRPYRSLATLYLFRAGEGKRGETA